MTRSPQCTVRHAFRRTFRRTFRTALRAWAMGEVSWVLYPTPSIPYTIYTLHHRSSTPEWISSPMTWRSFMMALSPRTPTHFIDPSQRVLCGLQRLSQGEKRCRCRSRTPQSHSPSFRAHCVCIQVRLSCSSITPMARGCIFMSSVGPCAHTGAMQAPRPALSPH